MLMWEYGIAHSVVMTIGWLMAFAFLGSLIYFAISIRVDEEKAPKE